MDPKLVYVTRDSRTYSGDTAFQIVDAMRIDSMFTDEKNLQGYMKTAAARFAEFDGITVRTDSPDDFVADLVTAGVLTLKSMKRDGTDTTDQGA